MQCDELAVGRGSQGQADHMHQIFDVSFNSYF